jgi:hypothetical protein
MAFLYTSGDDSLELFPIHGFLKHFERRFDAIWVQVPMGFLGWNSGAQSSN